MIAELRNAVEQYKPQSSGDKYTVTDLQQRLSPLTDVTEPHIGVTPSAGVTRPSRSRSVTNQCSGVTSSAGVTELEPHLSPSSGFTDRHLGVTVSAGVAKPSHSQSVTAQQPGVTSSAGVTRLSRSRSLSSAERQHRDTFLLQQELHDALRKLDNMKLALAAKVRVSSSISKDSGPNLLIVTCEKLSGGMLVWLCVWVRVQICI